MRLSDTADSFVFMGATLGRQNNVCLRQHDKGYDCDKYFFDCHGVFVPWLREYNNNDKSQRG
jgi:hypothetical protein